MLSTALVKCGKCKFAFHNNANTDKCPRCGKQINPNLVQGSIRREQRDKLEELERILYFSFGDEPAATATEQNKKGLANVPIGITPTDKDLTQSVRKVSWPNRTQE